MSEQSMYK